MNNPKVSIITPTYNMGKYIENNINSVYSQKYYYIEHLIIDNYSSDNTEDIVNKYRHKYDLKYLREKDSGQANAINKGLDLVTGDIICWLNADDYYFSDQSIEKVVDIFNSDRDIDVLTGKGIYVKPDGTIIKTINLPRSIKELYFHDPILQPATFWKRNSIRLNESYNYVFDWILFLEFLRSGMRFYLFDVILAAYQLDGKNKTILDMASRKHEVFQVNLKYNGINKINIWWCYLIYIIYFISEKTGILWLKKITRYINSKIYKWTGKIYSS